MRIANLLGRIDLMKTETASLAAVSNRGKTAYAVYSLDAGRRGPAKREFNSLEEARKYYFRLLKGD